MDNGATAARRTNFASASGKVWKRFDTSPAVRSVEGIIMTSLCHFPCAPRSRWIMFDSYLNAFSTFNGQAIARSDIKMCQKVVSVHGSFILVQPAASVCVCCRFRRKKGKNKINFLPTICLGATTNGLGGQGKFSCIISVCPFVPRSLIDLLHSK